MTGVPGVPEWPQPPPPPGPAPAGPGAPRPGALAPPPPPPHGPPRPPTPTFGVHGVAGGPFPDGRPTQPSGDEDHETRRVLAVVLAASLVLGIVAVIALGLPGSVGPRPGDAGATGSAPCGLEAPWRCATVEVPAQRTPAGVPASRLDVLYAVLPASSRPAGAPRRVLVLVDGGPGSSGVEDGPWMAQALDPRIPRAFDVVAFDARGTGGTDAHECPRAGNRFGTAPITAETARAFATDCVAEVGLPPDTLARFSSREIAEDLDAIRAALGVERITVYGSSYGTVIAQAYAAAHPDRLDGLVRDAPIDRSMTATDLWVRAAEGFGTALRMTLDACSDDPDCSEALPDPSRAVDRVYQQLETQGRMSETIIGPDGAGHRRSMTRADFEGVVESTMYDETSRVLLLRALQAADHGDRRQLLRLVDVEGGAGHAASFSYFATWCADVRASPTADEEDFAAFTGVAVAAGVPVDARGMAWALAPCLYWPGQPASWSPPAEATTVPTLILSATGDPITPVGEARAILARHPEARLVETQGGAHGSLGEDCPGSRVADFVVDGRLPVGPTSVCAGNVIDSYIPVAPSPAISAEDAALGVFWELIGAPEVAEWDGERPLSLGCADAGTARLDTSGRGSRADVTLDGCAWASNATFGGSGWIDLSTWDGDLRLDSSRGSLHMIVRGDRWTLTGTWDDKAVDERG